MKLTIDPVRPDSDKPLYFDYITEGIQHLIASQNSDGSWGNKNSDPFQKIYYTTQVVQCLLKGGFPTTSEEIGKAFAFLDNFREPIAKHRARFFLYIALDKLSEDEIRSYLEMLKRIQREDGSFYHEMKNLKEKEGTIDEWPEVRRGSFVFYSLHALHFLSMIDDQKYRSLAPLKNEVWNKTWQMLLERMKKNSPHYTLLDPTSEHGDPELTSYALGILQKKEYTIPNFSEVIKWLLDKQVAGSWLNSPKVTSFVIIDLSAFSFDNLLLPKVKKAISEGMEWLISRKENWEKSANLTALAISALISGNLFLNPGFQEAFFVNYSEVLRKEIKERERRIRREEKKTIIQNIVFFILGLVVPLIIEYLLIPLFAAFL